MKISELTTKNSKDLRKLLNEKKDSLQSFKLGNSRSKTKNVKEGRELRKDIARIMTVLNRETK
jgi:ribosomal protein L29